MSKNNKLILLTICILMLTGCKKNNITRCSMTSNQSLNEYLVESSYTIYSNKDIVNKVVIVEEITSDNYDLLSSFEEQLNSQYEFNSNNYGGYTFYISNKENKIISNVIIDYTEMNMESFIERNDTMKDYINEDNRITLEGIKSMYESVGAVCE